MTNKQFKDIRDLACLVLYVALTVADTNEWIKVPPMILEGLALAGGWGLKAKLTRRQ